MGLQKTVIDGQNQSGNYWRVSGVNCGGCKDKRAIINIEQYKDKATRDAADPNANDPMDTRTYHLTQTEYDAHFSLADLDTVDQNDYTQAYEYLITLDGTDANGIDWTTGVVHIPADKSAD